MKAKKHAKDLREEAAERRKKQWRPEKETAGGKSASAPAAGRPGEALSRESEQTPEEEALAFLAYLEKDSPIPPKEDGLPSRRREKKPPSPVRVLNLEQGMPTVEEALSRLRLEIQRLKSEGAKAAKLIHGYGSTGRGGKICVGVRQELARMQNRRMIRLYVAGEDFGPFDENTRRFTDSFRDIARDPDYGKCNQGITMVLL